jgi:hypothetical protein
LVVGTFESLTPAEALEAQQIRAGRAFFDNYLRNRDNHLLDGPSPRFPDIQFEP